MTDSAFGLPTTTPGLRIGLFGAAAAHGRKRAFDVAAAHVSRHPDARFQSHDAE